MDQAAAGLHQRRDGQIRQAGVAGVGRGGYAGVNALTPDRGPEGSSPAAAGEGSTLRLTSPIAMREGRGVRELPSRLAAYSRPPAMSASAAAIRSGATMSGVSPSGSSTWPG